VKAAQVSGKPLGSAMTRDDPRQVSVLLDGYASLARPSSEIAEKVEGYLRSSREGIQVKAAQTLAKWLRPSSKTALREWLLSTYDRRHGSGVRAHAAKTLAPFIKPKDAVWVLDLYFERAPRRHQLSTILEIRALLPLVAALPASAISQRARIEGTSPKINRRRAAVFALHAAGDAGALRNFASDVSPEIRATAKNLLARIGAA
jgi:hypothetical protein